MTTARRRMTEVPGTEALWLLAGASHGRLVYVRRENAVVRPAVHVLEYGRLTVRAPVQAAALSGGAAALTYHADEIRTADGTGWSVTATGDRKSVV